MPSLKITPFMIDIPDADLDELRARLLATRWPAVRANAAWTDGVADEWVRSFTAHWTDAYDWRDEEARLNTFPQYLTTIDGQQIHFVHVRSRVPGALPLIMTHGWPSTFADFSELIGPLTDPEAYGGSAVDTFDVVVPSIPGFGFSGPTTEPGWDSTRIARAWDTLMRGLGYDHYVAHGGDAGSFITRELGVAAPEGLRAIHVLEVWEFPTGADGELDQLTDEERARLDFMTGYYELSGYQDLNQRRPLTPAYALTDSPVGQLAWIGDPLMGFGRFAPPEPRNPDAVLTNVSLYWFTNTAGSSARWYREDAITRAQRPSAYNPTPTGVAVTPYNFQSVRAIAERSNAVTGWSVFERGGHYAALDVPDLLVADIRQFFRNHRTTS